MTLCPHDHLVQAHLDGDLDPVESAAFLRHLAGCPACAAEIEAFGPVFEVVRTSRIKDPGPALTERILDRVLPSRLRRRWVSVLGWSYTGVTAATTFVAASWMSRPDTPVWIVARLADAWFSLIQAGLFVLHAVTFSWPRLLEGWGLITDLALRFVPLARALVMPFGHPVVGITTWAAALTCVAVLWWMRPRPAHQEIRHVDLLGF